MFLVFDIGGSKTRIGISPDGYALTRHLIFPTPTDFPSGINLFSQAASQLSPNNPITTIVGGIPGVLNPQKTVVISSKYQPLWQDQPLADTLSAKFNCPVYLENDAALVGLGEATAGAGQNYPIVAYITISTGVGGSRIVDGHIDAKATGFEPGRQILFTTPDSPTTLEELVSGSAIQAKYHTHPKDITDPTIWQNVESYLAIGLYNTILHWSPHVIVLGGAMMVDLSPTNLTSLLATHSSTFPFPPLVKFSLGETAGLIGSLAYLRQQMP